MRRLGRFELAAVDAGTFWLDGGAMFGVVPRPLWQRSAPPDAENRVRLALRPLLVVDNCANPPRRILIDTGLSDKLPVQLVDRLHAEPPQGGLRGAIQRAGVDPDSITDVILTHLHFDHAGGATTRASGRLMPTFPRATYHVQRRALKWAEHAPEKDRRSYHPEDYEPLATSGVLHLLDGPCELFEGISLVMSEGHTVGLQLPLIDGGDDGKVLYCADIIPTRAHVALTWIMAFDLYPLTTLEEKRLLLAQGIQEGWTLFFEHDPIVQACRLAERDGQVVASEPVAF